MKPLAQNTLIQNRYLIVQLIGKGGMGEVYLAVDQRLGSAIALKRTLFAGDEALGSAFEREARVLARMRHPVLPKVSDHFGEGEEQFLVMEHISGDDLSKRLEAAQKPFPVSWVMFWADQLLDALSYLHSHEPPVIHRDIKPQNLKLTDENHVILLDFGLSKSSTGQTNLGPTSATSSTGSVVGYTPHYAPMEQIRGIGTNPRSDIYSLAATLYQLLTNTVPVDALSRADTMLNASPDPVQPLYEINPEVPKEISDVVLRGMEVSQERRFESAREMQKALRRAYNEMQSAMSAKTVVIGGAAEFSSAVSRPSASSDPNGSATAEPAEALEPDFGATLVYDQFPNVSPEEPQQSGIKTEVFIPGVEAFVPEAAEETPSAPVERSEPELPDFAMTNAYSAEGNDSGGSFSDEEGFDPNATMQVGAVEGSNLAEGSSDGFDSYSPAEQPAGFQTVAASGSEMGNSDAGYQETGYQEEQNYEASAAAVPQQAAIAAPAKKKGGAGKVIAVLAVLALLFVLGAGAVGGVWYYMNYVAVEGGDPTPTPTPDETLAPTPSPEEEVVLPSPTPDESPTATPEATVTPITEPRQTPVGPRPTPVQTRPTPTRPVRTPTPRPRPTILQ